MNLKTRWLALRFPAACHSGGGTSFRAEQMVLSRTGWKYGLLQAAFFAGVLGILWVCYGPALRGGLLWDDAAHVTRPELQSWSGLARIWTDLHATQQYYPVLHSAFWFEHRILGDATLGYHCVNLVAHALACVLIVGVVRQLGKLPATGARHGDKVGCSGGGGVPPGTGWLGATLFALHPVCAESVAWISEQKNTLSLVSYLLAAGLYLKFHDGRRWRFYAGATLFFLLALGTKTVTCTLPAALLVVLWWREGTVSWRRDVLPLLPWFVSAGAAGLFTAWVERVFVGAHGTAFSLNMGERVLLAARVIWFYLGKLFWPAELIFIYPRWNVTQESAGWWVCVAGVLGVTLVLWLMRERARGPLAAWLFFVGSLFPALGFFDVYPFQFSYVADHFQYLPALGMMVLLGAGFAELFARTSGVLRISTALAFTAAAAVFAVRTHVQSQHYRDSQTLYRETLARNPKCWMAHINLAAELVKTPEGVSEAILHDRAALSEQPENTEAHNNLGTALLLTPDGRTEAIEHFEAALKIDPSFTEARLNLANVLALIPARLPEALADYEEVLRLRPESPEPHFCFANTLAKIPGRAEQASREYEIVLTLRPNYAEAHENFAALLAGPLGDLESGLSHYREALRLAPDSAKTHYNYALALERLPDGQSEAVAQYQEALRLNPSYAEAHNNLGIFFAQRGQFDLAREQWEVAARLNPQYEDPSRNLLLLDRRRGAR